MSNCALGNSSTNFELCFLCQADKKENLIEPMKAKKQSPKECYESMVKILKVFDNYNKLPLRISSFMTSENPVLVLYDNSASWHKACRLKYSKVKAESLTNQIEEVIPVIPNLDVSDVRTLRSHLETSSNKERKCVFCDNDEEGTDLQKVTTLNADQKIRNAAEYLKDHSLLAKLGPGDLVATEALYHLNCISSFYNTYNAAVKRSGTKDREISWTESVAFEELCEHVDYIINNNKKVVLPLDELRNLMENRMEDLGQYNNVHTTRFKLKIMERFPQLEVTTQGKKIVFTKNVTNIQPESDDEEDRIFLKVARLVREHLFDTTSPIGDTDQESSVPSELVKLLGMIFYGFNPSPEDIQPSFQAILTIAQLIKFNSFKTSKRCSNRSFERKNYQHQETPIVRYIGNLIHHESRSRQIIDKLHHLGLSISYKRVLNISTCLGNLASSNYEKTGVVCPRNLWSNEFVTVAVDNIDHNMSSATSMGSFHGTAISVRTHPDCKKEEYDFQQIDDIILPKTLLSIKPLPTKYTVVELVPEVDRKTLKIPNFVDNVVQNMDFSTNESTVDTELEKGLKVERQWLNLVDHTVQSGELIDHTVHWSSFHASLEKESSMYPSAIALLPLFQETSHNYSMMNHALKIAETVTDCLNKNQNPVIEADEPLYAMLKELQWAYPERFGKIIIMLGGLHQEMVILRCLGQLLEGSEWDVILTEANVATEGVAQSFFQGKLITKTRHAHQVTAAALHILKKRAFSNSGLEDTPQNFQKWEAEHLKDSPTFFYWNTVLDLELKMLQFVKSIRQGNLDLYVNSLEEIVPWYFTFDHNKYSRWTVVHLEDMKELPKKFPQVHSEFVKGKFVVKKTSRPFSAIAIDHSHEQENAIIKGEGGSVGLLDNPLALLRWMVAGPEVCHLINEFEKKYIPDDDEFEDKHHTQYKSAQNRFMAHVNALVEVIEVYGSPFESGSSKLETVVTKFQFGETATNNLRAAYATGKKQWNDFISRMKARPQSFYDPIKNNNLLIFKEKPSPKVSKVAQKYKLLKNDVSLFSRLYIGATNRTTNLNEFFEHENQAFPVSISENGNIRTSVKSKIVDCLEKTIIDLPCSQPTHCTAYLADGSVNVRFINTTGVTTFAEYSTKFNDYLSNFANAYERVDVVWDTYAAQSIKNGTRQKRGQGREQKVEPNCKIPKNWDNFLCVDENKTKLYNLLAKRLVEMDSNNCTIVTTINDGVLSSKPIDSSGMSPCNHEEADTRLMVHVADAVSSGHTRIIIRTVDSDIVVLAAALMAEQPMLEEFWIAYGTKKSFRYIPIHSIVKRLGRLRAMALPFFHALTGCDTVSAFFGIGKLTAWDIWDIMGSELTNAFLHIEFDRDLDTSENFKIIEKFIIMCYDYKDYSPDTHYSMNTARQFLFIKKSRPMEKCPPTNAAFIEHLRRAVYQGSFIWGSLSAKCRVVPDAKEWGWKLCDNELIPHWTNLSELSKISRQLLSCKCKKSCKKGRCTCKNAGISCTLSCICNGTCFADLNK